WLPEFGTCGFLGPSRIPPKGSTIDGRLRASAMRAVPAAGLLIWNACFSNGVPTRATCWPQETPMQNHRGKPMKIHVRTLLVGAALMAMGGLAMAHHSFAMFDQEHPVDLVGVVKEWKYTAPHAFIILEVKEADGNSQLWSLEGGAPSGLIRDGWTSKTLKPG